MSTILDRYRELHPKSAALHAEASEELHDVRENYVPAP